MGHGKIRKRAALPGAHRLETLDDKHIDKQKQAQRGRCEKRYESRLLNTSSCNPHAYSGYAAGCTSIGASVVAESLVLQIVVDLAAIRATKYGGESGEAGRETTGRMVAFD